MAQEHRISQPPPRVFMVGLLAAMASILLAILAVPVLALMDKPAWYAAAIPFGVAAAVVFLWNTRYGLYFTAFAIAPLGIVQHEFAGVTLNLPEMMVLALFAKEFLLFVWRGERLSRDFPAAALLIYVAASSVGILTGILRGSHFVVVFQDFRQYFEFILFYLLVLHRVHDRRQIVFLLVSFLAGLILIAVHGIIQRYTGWGISSYQMMSDEILHSGIRAGSFYGATPLGALMVLAIGTAAGLGLSLRSKMARAAILACAAIAVAAAVFTYTRASWIAIAVSLLFVFMGIKKTPLMIAGAAVLLLIFSSTMGALVIQRMGKTEVSKREQSLLERFEYYTAAWHIFRAHPLLGLGWGCEFNVTEINLNGRYVPAPHRFRGDQSAAAGDSSASSRYLQTYKAVLAQSTVHSAYLQILVRAGLLGIIPFAFFLLPWLRALLSERHHRDRNAADHNLYIGVAAGLLGYFVHALVENFFQWPVMAQSFWLLLGLTTIMAIRLRTFGTIDPPDEHAAPEGATA